MPAPVTSRYFLVLLSLCLMVTAQTVVRADQIDEHMQREKERLDTILYGMQRGSQATMDGEEARINARLIARNAISSRSTGVCDRIGCH